MKILPRYSFGTGDRFGLEGRAQLAAIREINRMGAPVCPVWNKSNREHTIIGSRPADLRAEADAAVRELGWTEAYFVDADHINLGNVEGFLACSDFFTIDVADYVGTPSPRVAEFVARRTDLLGDHGLPLSDNPLTLDRAAIESAANKFLAAIEEAGKIARHIAAKKGGENFALEVSIDETDQPQSPSELLVILAMLAEEGIAAQTVAPKFTGRFNKGVDYVGDIGAFTREFDADLSVIAYAVQRFGLPESLKISVHSGSDKFSLYPIIRQLLDKHGAGLHLKTAGTTWLEEVIGLAEAGGSGLEIAKAIYAEALDKADSLLRKHLKPLFIPDAA